jgi:hypothetical protein
VEAEADTGATSEVEAEIPNVGFPNAAGAATDLSFFASGAVAFTGVVVSAAGVGAPAIAVNDVAPKVVPAVDEPNENVPFPVPKPVPIPKPVVAVVVVVAAALKDVPALPPVKSKAFVLGAVVDDEAAPAKENWNVEAGCF